MPLCFSSKQTCNRCSFSVDVHTVATLLQSRFPTLPAKRVEMNLSPWPLFLGGCVCSRLCHRRHLSSLSYFSTLCVFVCTFSLLLFFSLPPSLSLSVPHSRKINRPCCLVPFFTQTFIVYVFVCSRSLAVGTTQPVFVVCDECLRETDAVDKRTNKAACRERDERGRERQGFRKIQSNVRASRRKECMRQENQFLKKQI